MIALLRKDWQVNQSGGIGCLIILGGMLIVATAMLVFSGNRFDDAVPAALFVTGSGGLMLTPFMAAVFGGMAFAPERRDRSANFLAILPVSRSRIIYSKLIVAATWLFSLVLISGGLIIAVFAPAIFLGKLDATTQAYLRDLGAIVIAGASVAFMLFGIAWLLSSFLTSPAISASVSIGATAALLSYLGARQDHPVTAIQFFWSCLLCCSLIGITTFTVGTVHYLRRFEP